MASSRLAYLGRLLRRLWIFLAGYAAVVLIATFGFYFLESGSPGLLNSLYWAMITLSTIGYGDVVPNDPLAKVFTIGIAATEVFLGAYLVSIIIAGVQEEGQHRALGTLGTNLSGHVVVLGYGPVGRAAVRELLAQEEKVAVVADDPADVANLRLLADDKHLFATYGPAGDLEILRRVNVPGALAVIVCTPDDTVTLVAALNVRELSPNGRIVVSVGRPELRHTLRAAGVTYVTSPGDMGGRICADASFRPEVANTIEDLTTTEFGVDLEEFVLSEKTPVSHQPLLEAERLVRSASDCLVVGYARPDAKGEYRTVLNPPASFKFQPGDALLVIGTLENLQRLHRWLGVDQGR
ncbi:MAG: NAD-binding protein [Thermoplasmata archaeon]